MLKKILIPVDGSDYSKSALKRAINLANPDSELILLHVTFSPDAYFGHTFPHGICLSQEDCKRIGDLEIENTLKDVDPGDLKVTKVIIAGNPASVIIHYAEEHNIDLIVIGSHGHGAIAGAFLGSVTQRVLAESKTSVVLVKPTDPPPESNNAKSAINLISTT